MSDETTGRPTEAPLCYEMQRPGVRGVGEAIALIRAGEWGGAIGPGNAIATVWLGGPAGTSAAPEDVEATAVRIVRASNAFEPKRKALVETYGYDVKNAAHLVRLLKMGIEFLRDGVLNVYRSADAAELIEIKTGRWPLAKVQAYADALFAEFHASHASSPLPEEPDAEAAEALCVEIVRDFFAGGASVSAPLRQPTIPSPVSPSGSATEPRASD